MSKTILPMMMAGLMFVGASLPLQNASAHFCIQVDGLASVESETYLPPHTLVLGGTCDVDDCYHDGWFHDHLVIPGNPPEPPPPLTLPTPTAQQVIDFVAWALGLEDVAFDECDKPPGGCETQETHNYASGSRVGADSRTADQGEGGGFVTVWDANGKDCNGDGVPGDWDGDYENGVGGGFFGWGPWADEDICNHDLNVHGANVVVNDLVFGDRITFVLGEDDMAGPTIIRDPVTNEVLHCETDGSITPSIDSDDCISDSDGDPTNGHQPYTGVGATCGPGGGDGGFWVFLEGGQVNENGGVSTNNPPTSGTITAF